MTPTSWPTQGFQLSDWVTPVADIPSPKKIYWIEAVDDISPRKARLSRDVGSAATMDFLTNADALTDPQLNMILTKSILGGYHKPTNKKYPPLRHPQWCDLSDSTDKKGQYAKDFIDCTELGYDAGNATKLAEYEVARVRVNFESLNYKVEKVYSPMDNFNPNWVSGWGAGESRSTNQRASIPIGWYKFKSDNPNYPNLPALFGNYTTQPMEFKQFTFYEVPYSLVYTFGIQPNGSTDYGLINDAPFGGYDTHTLLLDSIETSTYSDWFGEPMLQVRLNVIWNQWNWDFTLDPSGRLGEVEFAAQGGTGTNKPPYEETSFPDFWDFFNPR